MPFTRTINIHILTMSSLATFQNFVNELFLLLIRKYCTETPQILGYLNSHLTGKIVSCPLQKLVWAGR